MWEIFMNRGGAEKNMAARKKLYGCQVAAGPGRRLSPEVVQIIKRLLEIGVPPVTVAKAAKITPRMARYYRQQLRDLAE